MKKCVIGAKETHPDILGGGHRNPYQLENAIKSGGPVFCIYLPGTCDQLARIVHISFQIL